MNIAIVLSIECATAFSTRICCRCCIATPLTMTGEASLLGEAFTTCVTCVGYGRQIWKEKIIERLALPHLIAVATYSE